MADVNQAKFAEKYIRALRRAGLDEAIRFVEAEFMLETAGGRKLYLANVFDECQKASFWKRGRVLARYAASMMDLSKGVPETFEQAKPNLVPRVRQRTWFGVMELRFAGEKVMPFSYEPITDDLAVELVYDTPNAIASVNPDHLARWGLSFADALRTARHNLRLSTKGTLESVRPGVFQSPWRDNHDSSRILLTELISRLEVRGAPVAMIPMRDILLVTGADDVEGLGTVADIAEPALQQPRTVSGVAYVFVDGTWRRFEPPPGHPQRERFRLMARMTAAEDYEAQKQLLDKTHERDGTDIFVGSFLLLRNRTTGAATSLSTWAYNAVSLLPRTDEIAIADGPGDAPDVQVPWERAAEVVGDLLRPQGLVPERYLVERSPTPQQFDRLRAVTKTA